MALKGKTKSFKEEEEDKKGKNTGGSVEAAPVSGTSGRPAVTQPIVPGLPRAGSRGQVVGVTNSMISQNFGPSKFSVGKAPAPALTRFGEAGYRAGSSLRTSGLINSVTAWRPPKPRLSYEQAAESAVRLYDEYTKKQTAFEERYGGLEHPEMYYGWKQRGDELTELEERYGKMLDHMNRHYLEMEVEPTFTFSGTAADVTPYQQQIDQMRSELEDYVSASNGLPDPSYVRQQQTNIARLQAALDTLPTEAPGEEAFFSAVAQTIMGNYYDKTTALGTVMQAALSAIPHPVAEVLDLAADIRDVVYDFSNEEASKVGTFFDVLGFAPGAFDTLKYFKHAEAVGPLVKGLLALLPAAEVLKYVDDLGLLGKGAKRADDMADLADAAADTARAGQRLTETGEIVADTAKATERTLESADEVIDSIDDLEYNHRVDSDAKDVEGLWRDRISELPSEIDELYSRGWREITPSQMSENSTSRLFVDDKSGLIIRFDRGKTDGSGYGKVDHYHVLNPNSTGKGDYYLDCNGNPVPKNSKASHIIP